MKKIISVILIISCLTILLVGCESKDTKTSSIIVPDSKDEVTLTIAGPWADCEAIEKAAASFTEKYSNCHVLYEYIQDFDKSLSKRIDNKEDKVDLVLTSNIDSESPFIDYYVDLSSVGNKLDLSNTFPGLVDNFRIKSADASENSKLYVVPLGAEVRGMFVNVTLLNSLGITVPQNKGEFLQACKVLMDNGYIPIQGNPGMFAQQFLYPQICSMIANSDNYQETYDLVNRHGASTADFIQEPLRFMYDLVDKGYYNYKVCETELGTFTDSSDEGYARSFFNIVKNGNDYEKKDDKGIVAFMPKTQALDTVMKKCKEDYHSEIEYQFILSPTGDNGGYAYLSPGRGIAVNKNSDNVDWSIAFVSYLLQPEENEKFSNDIGYVTNSKDAFDILLKTYTIPKTNISHVGQVTFDYGFFSVVNSSLVEISKANNPKYMQINEDGTTAMYSFDYYLDRFKQKLEEIE